MMKAQDQMELPIGLVMRESGARLPRTHLVDPHAALRAVRRGKRMLPLLLWKEKKLRRKMAALPLAPPVLPNAPAIDRHVAVF
jgi:hypothetical protein